MSEARTDHAEFSSRINPEERGQKPRYRLLSKYIALFVAVVTAALLASGGLQAWFSFGEQIASRERLQREQAGATALSIEHYLEGIRSQLAWTTQLPIVPETLEQRRFDLARLLSRTPAVTEVSQLDGAGREQLRLSRIAMDVIGSGEDLSTSEAFITARAEGVYFGPVYFRRESEPYMIIAQAGSTDTFGITIAEVNLKFIWDIVDQIDGGDTGYAYVVDAQGHLIAHSDISLVLRNLDLSALPQFSAAFEGRPLGDAEARSLDGQDVVSAAAAVPLMGWWVFVELPVAEALAPIYASLFRSGGLLLVGLVVATIAGVLLSRRMAGPIEALQLGAAKIGGGDLDFRIDIQTGDELEALANDFNHMAQRLAGSHAELARRVEERTAELAKSLAELKALGDVSQAVNSSLDLQGVLTTIVGRAVQLSTSSAGGIHQFDQSTGLFRLIASYGSTAAYDEKINALRIAQGETAIGTATSRRVPVQVPEIADLAPSPVRDVLQEGGYRALLALPLLSGDHILGALVVRRSTSGAFPPDMVRLLQALASQSAIAIRNAQLFQEASRKSELLEEESAHKSQFLANMSHELRTPLNAILGFTELLLDQIYGELPDRAYQVVERLQVNGMHLLELINDVLDLSKIEAGQFALSFEDYDICDVVRSVAEAAEPLAAGKQLRLIVELTDTPLGGLGDERRLRQVLLNLVGNAIKFTETGHVRLRVREENAWLEIAVEDTGAGIDPNDHDRIFLEFQQVDNSSIRSKGGSGLGLPISKRIIEMHGGSISVQSMPGAGSIFTVKLPLRAGPLGQAA